MTEAPTHARGARTAEPLAVHAVRGSELTASELHDLLRLRVDVFVVEQACPYPELDGRDLHESTDHLWMADAAGPVAALRVVDDAATRRIGRVVTRSDQRGRGMAAALMAAALERTSGSPTVLDAQTYLVDFYRGLGYQSTGPEFVEDGIPHVPMARPADAHRVTTIEEEGS